MAHTDGINALAVMFSAVCFIILTGFCLSQIHEMSMKSITREVKNQSLKTAGYGIAWIVLSPIIVISAYEYVMFVMIDLF